MATATIPRGRKDSTKTPGRFGVYGGRYVPETLVSALEELERAYEKAKRDRKFQVRLDDLLRTYAGRPTPLFFARRLTEKLAGAKIYLKREDLLHTGAHKINNCLGQALLAERMGKRRIIAETGAGQHGVATATVCALFGFECVVYMGTADMRRQELNVFRMRLLGAEVRGVESGSRTLKDAINEAMRDWVTNVRTTHYLLGSVLGAHPYPTMVRDFQTVIGREAREQILAAEKRLPTHLFACVGGGSNSIGLFHQFLRAVEIDLRQVTLCLGGRKLGAFLPGIQFNQHIAGMHRLTGLEVDFVNGARKIGANRHALNRLRRTDNVQSRRPGFLFGHDGGDSTRRRREAGALCDCSLNLFELHETQAGDQNDHHSQHQKHPLQHVFLLKSLLTKPLRFNQLRCRTSAERPG